MPKVAIYGSCVSRDTKNFFSNDWKVSSYVARQSLISAASGVADVEGESGLASAFQNRMIQFDIAGNGFEVTRQALEESELLLIDLVDERRGVWRTSSGKYVTNSFEMQRSGLMKRQLADPEYLAFGSDPHFALWLSALDGFAELITNTNVRTFLLAPDFAPMSKNGKSMSFWSAPVREINQKYARYYDAVADRNLPVLKPPADTLLADEDHQWGLESFHYVPEVYQFFTDKIFDTN